jgi:hypothetical protein
VLNVLRSLVLAGLVFVRTRRQLIRRISSDQPGWGEDRIADELAVKLGVHHSTSTIRRYMVRRREPWGGVPKRSCWLAASACRIG